MRPAAMFILKISFRKAIILFFPQQNTLFTLKCIKLKPTCTIAVCEIKRKGLEHHH